MQSAYIINDRTGKPYAVVGILPGGTEFYPIAESSVSWASWMTADFAAKKITKQELSVTLDNSMSLEGPMPVNRINKAKIDELIKKAKKVSKEQSDKEVETEEKVLLPVISLLDARIDNLENTDWRNAVNFKAKSFIADANKSTFSYEIKRTRAVWDPSLSIPGTERRGGFRCPPGTRYGGQITDRFGRNCGWGVARRLANEIADLGERVENIDDNRRGRRVARRNERVARRLQQGGRVERAARAIGNALETGPAEERGPGRLERIARRVGDALDTPNTPTRPKRNRRGEGRRDGEGRLERVVRRLEEIADGNDGSPTPAPRRPRPAAPQARPARPRQPRRPRPLESPVPQGRSDNRFRDMNDADLRKEWEKNKPYMPERGRIGMDATAEAAKAKRRREIELEMRRRGMVMPEGARPVINIPQDEFVPEVQPQGRRPRPNRPRQIDLVDNTSKTPVPAGPPQADETLDQYKRRKYNEHQARVRKIRDEGGNAGFLRYEEWEQFHGPAVEDNWNRAQVRNGGRGARRVATDAGAGRTATRRPAPADVPDANQPARRQRRPFNAPGQRGLGSEAAARRKRNQMEVDNRGAVRYNLVKHNGKYYVVDREEVARANAAGANLDVVNEPPRPPVRPRSVDAPPAPPAPPRPPQSGKARKPLTGLLQHNPKRDEVNHGHKVVNGIYIPEHVAVGNNGIGNKNQAAEHLRNGGSLDEVPDLLLKDAIFDNAAMPGQPLNGKRFKLDGDPGNGINNREQNNVRDKTYLVTDTVTGRRYILKSPSFQNNEHIGEQVGGFVGQLLGRPMPRVRIAAPVVNRQSRRGNGRNNASILMEHFGDVIDSPGDIVDGYREPNAKNRQSQQLVNAIDKILGNPDRHPGNYLWAGGEQLPIDHGILGDQVPSGARRIPPMSTTAAQRFNVTYPEMAQKIKEFRVEQIDEMIDAMADNWRKANPGGLDDGAQANLDALKRTLKAIIEA